MEQEYAPYLDNWSTKTPVAEAIRPVAIRSTRLPRPTMTSYDPWAEDGGNVVDLTTTTTSSPSISLTSPNPEVAEEEDEEQILENTSLSREQKQYALQKILFNAASNGDVVKVHSLLGGGPASELIDVNAKDDSGSTALIYSSCFGNESMVNELLRFDADVDQQDKNEWTALMWAINNHHFAIVTRLLENSANVNLKTSTGRSALDFVSSGSEIYNYMKKNGYIDDHDSNDFYDDGQIATATTNDQMRLESSFNLDLDMRHLDIHDETEDIGLEEQEAFIWDKCMPDQMFVFNEHDIPRILDEAISKMQPQRSRSQKPIPANMIFLSARYALNYGTDEMLENLLTPTLTRIRSVVMDHNEDLAFLAFWISNCTLLLYYTRKDHSLFEATVSFQEKLSELIVDIYVLITQDVERRMDSLLESSILDHDTIPGMEDIQYQSEWRIFRRQHKQLTRQEEIEQTTRPPSPKRKAKPSPRNITSILGSVLFVMDLYEVHPIITHQIISQILYWLGATLFNRIMANRKYLARSRAMQIRLNISAIEDWARINNRRPENSDEFSAVPEHRSISEICQKHFAPLIQLLQWLQCFSGFGDDFTNVIATLQQLTELNPLQLLHVANKYRAEVGEKGLSKEYKKYLAHLKEHYRNQVTHIATTDKPPAKQEAAQKEVKQEEPAKKETHDKQEQKLDEELAEVQPEPEVVQPGADEAHVTRPTIVGDSMDDHDEEYEELYLDARMVLPFMVPTLREMIVTYGAGLGGTHTARARKYEPSLPTDFLDRFEDAKKQEEDELQEEEEEESKAEPLFKEVAMPTKAHPQPLQKWDEMGENIW